MPATPGRALVTGVAGQDGSYLAERLLGEGTEVHGLIRSADDRVVAGVIPHVGDVTEPGLFERLLAEVRPDEVYHLAALSSVAQSWAEPLGTAEINAMSVARLLHAAQRAAHHPRVLVTSSAEVFGAAEEVPQNESTPLRPTSPYGAAKAYAQLLAGSYRRTGMPVSCVILFNHESPRRPDGFVTRKITRTVAAIGRGTSHELVLGNLDAQRDWGWAPDYVEAMLRAQRHHEPDDYVIATGTVHSIRDFVAAAFAHTGTDRWEHLVRVDPNLTRPGDPAVQCGDATRARTVLGWKPTVSFAEIVRRMVDAERP